MDNFAEFWALLARVNVEAGVLAATFRNEASVTAPTYTALQYIHNPEAELVRNPFWNKISQAFSPILIDQPENDPLQEEVIRNCYVLSPLADESTSSLAELLPGYQAEVPEGCWGTRSKLVDRGPRLVPGEPRRRPQNCQARHICS